MAIDTAAKRASILSFGSPISELLPIPDGVVDLEDRFHYLHLYDIGVISIPVTNFIKSVYRWF